MNVDTCLKYLVLLITEWSTVRVDREAGGEMSKRQYWRW